MHAAALTLLVSLGASALLLFFDWRLHVRDSRARAEIEKWAKVVKASRAKVD